MSTLNFLSLEDAVSAAYDWKGSVIFPLFMLEDNGYFTICTQEKSPVSPVYCNDIPEDVIGQDPQYASLTSMMQELVTELKDRE